MFWYRVEPSPDIKGGLRHRIIYLMTETRSHSTCSRTSADQLFSSSVCARFLWYSIRSQIRSTRHPSNKKGTQIQLFGQHLAGLTSTAGIETTRRRAAAWMFSLSFAWCMLCHAVEQPVVPCRSCHQWCKRTTHLERLQYMICYL